MSHPTNDKIIDRLLGQMENGEIPSLEMAYHPENFEPIDDEMMTDMFGEGGKEEVLEYYKN